MLNLVGKRFGQLTVLRKNGHKGNKVCWECKCDCGKLYYVITSNLTTGHTTRCDECSSKVRNLKGQIFGELTVLNKNDNYRKENNIKNTHAYWDCLCTCGNITTVKSNDLLDGSTTRCSMCANNQFIDEVGNKYGYLTILKYLGRRNKTGLWLAQCDCGQQCEIIINDLKRGKGKLSCGCKSYKSKGELLITKFLNDNDILYQSQFTFNDLVGKQNIKLPYDFAILDEANNPIRLIEYDGEQHYKSTEYFGGQSVYERRQELDKIKNEYALRRNIPLIRIPYTEYKNLNLKLLIGDKFKINE